MILKYEENGSYTTKSWIDLFIAYGVEKSYLTGEYGPCPKCGGKDRFTFNRRTGDCYCRQCHPAPLEQRNGIHGLAWALSISVSEATRRIREWEAKNGIKLSEQPLEAVDKSDEVNAAINSSIPLRQSEAGMAYLGGRSSTLS